MIKERIAKLLQKMRENNLDAFVISSYENYRYFSGFTGSNCTLIISEKALFALTDGRYDIQIRNQAKNTIPLGFFFSSPLTSSRIQFVAYFLCTSSFYQPYCIFILCPKSAYPKIFSETDFDLLFNFSVSPRTPRLQQFSPDCSPSL